jgi:preprotein translocase subunit SecA
MDRMGAVEGEVLTHPLVTRSIEQAQKRVELQNFQARKRLLDYDDVMNQQREVIYSLRSFALEGGEELRGESIKMVEKAITKRVTDLLAEFEDASQWDLGLVRQELLMHYLLTVPSLEGHDPPTTLDGVVQAALEAARAAFEAKEESLNAVQDESGQGFAPRLNALVMLNVLDEKWKDHLYDLDQLRAAIHYRSWGQKDPLIEYKQEAYTMFVDLMGDIHHTFTERFLRAQLVFNPQDFMGDGGEPPPPEPEAPRRPTKRYNALGILEDIVDEPLVVEAEYEEAAPAEDRGNGQPAPAEKKPVAKSDPVVVGAGRARSLSAMGSAPAGPVDFTGVGRNDPCPCGSGKKFKKCHGVGSG